MLKLGVYRHFKGRPYTVLHIAEHSETGEKFVVYRAEYGEGQVYIRPYDMFVETVDRDGSVKPRFEYVCPSK